MMNKLVYSKKFLLQPLLENLQVQANSHTHGRLNSLTERIKANNHKAETLTELMQSGLIDKSIYVNQTAQLEQDTYQCREKIKQFNSNNTDSANNFENVRALLHWCQQGKKLSSFNKAPFQNFVQQIVVNGPNNVVFKLKCGLRLTEKLTKAAGLDENFYRGVIRQRFNEPIRQAEYLYSIIESEDDLIG